ncbi:group II truncated hemoglobin [uncultured Alsobacter sp.]|uniref:group II truncated hemoglobin n=1 Tax=uncultured Alsobacter sp. TaxID=1748258 RepID=UPI0025E70746|nr:group II truncated hemoglobin [uncultured Alsobacter sp.]
MTDSTTVYDLIGAEEGVRRLTRRFYALMDTLPEAKAARAIHPKSLADSEQKLFEFMTGWLGGPPLFIERRGPPMLRARHLQAPIGMDEIEGWLACFKLSWSELAVPDTITEAVMPKVEALARHMHNRG